MTRVNGSPGYPGKKQKNIAGYITGAIEQSLIQACKNHFGKADNVHVTINPETCDFSVTQNVK